MLEREGAARLQRQVWAARVSPRTYQHLFVVRVPVSRTALLEFEVAFRVDPPARIDCLVPFRHERETLAARTARNFHVCRILVVQHGLLVRRHW